MISHPTNGYFYVIEGDHRVMGEEVAAKALEEKVSSGETQLFVLVLKKQTNTLLDTKNTFFTLLCTASAG